VFDLQGLFQCSHQYFQAFYPLDRGKESWISTLTNSHFGDTTKETEKTQKKIPHIDINMELFEAMHFTTCSILEATRLASGGKQSIVPNYFQKLFEHKLSTFSVEPRDHVHFKAVAATKAVLQSDCPQAFAIIKSMFCNSWLPSKDYNRLMLFVRQRLKKVALESFLIFYSAAYRSISLDYTSNLFSLHDRNLKSTIGFLIVNQAFYGSLDHATEILTIEKRPRKNLFQALRQFVHETIDSDVQTNKKTNISNSVDKYVEDKGQIYGKREGEEKRTQKTHVEIAFLNCKSDYRLMATMNCKTLT
jgi:hypothetical protein